MTQRKTTEQFVAEAKSVHGDIYNYNISEYKNIDTKVAIVCQKHGVFYQTPYIHVKLKCGCPKCAIEKNGKKKCLGLDGFIERANQVHNFRFDYSETQYKNGVTKVAIKCKKHGLFYQLPYSHLGGAICPKCTGRNKTTEDFIEEAKEIHGEKYDYNKVVYRSAKAKVEIICPIHGPFIQMAINHLQGKGCPKCSGNVPVSKEDFLKSAHKIFGNTYDYSFMRYKDYSTPVIIVCKEHGFFEQIPRQHIKSKTGCPKCSFRNLGVSYRMSKEDFIKRANNIHLHIYDYSLVEYKRNNIKVSIKCPVHGVFNQTPSVHLRGMGCPKCGYEKLSSIKKISNEEFIKKAICIHANHYDYSLVDYKGSNTNVIIECLLHGPFSQTPSKHLQGHGCPKCSGHSSCNSKEFIEKARSIHGDKFIYDLVDYKNTQTKVLILCPKHGPFSQTPSKHLQGNGCPKCIGRHKTTVEFIEEAQKIHNGVYNYDLVDYKGSTKKVTIVCPLHGPFKQIAIGHLSGKGCPKCGKSDPIDKEEFLKRAKEKYGDKFDFSLADYKKYTTSITITCPLHGNFKITPINFLQSYNGCPECSYKCSILEDRARKNFKKSNIQFLEQAKFDWMKFKRELSLDFYLPDYSIAIECQGVQHFKPVEKYNGEKGYMATLKRDKHKFDICKAHGINILYFANSQDYIPKKYHGRIYTSIRELINEILSSSFNA